jgi:hypothetical protein
MAGLFLTALATHLALYAFHVAGLVYPFGNVIYGIGIFSFLAAFIYYNNLLPEIANNKWRVLFLLYICISALWGYARFKTFSVSVYDLWLFSYIIILTLIRPFSFNVRIFDFIIASFVLLYVFIAVGTIALFPGVLYDRDMFSGYIAYPGMMAGGAFYLLLKYANKLSVLTLVGLLGVVADGILFGVAGAFRGRMLLSFIALILFAFLMLKSRKIKFGSKFFLTLTSGIVCVAAALIIMYKLGDQLFVVTERFEAITAKFDKTGSIMSSDARLNEFTYFRTMYPDRKLILGHGVGGLWYDFYGIYGAKIGGTFAGARTMLHMNWAHLIFKIGIVGLALLIAMLVSHWRRHPEFLKNNLSWWAFVIYYLAWSTYYGDKELTIRAMVLLMALVHPWLFKAFGSSSKGTVRNAGFPARMGMSHPGQQGRR